MKIANKLLSNKRVILVIYVAFALVATTQSILLKPTHYNYEAGKYIDKEDGQYTATLYNNYIIFKNSFAHLIQSSDLYKFYLNEHWDLYKYSPTFSLFMGLFYFLPDVIGLFLWNLLNAIVLLVAVYYLPNLSLKNKGLILISILVELMTCMQCEQSNALICGLIILAFGLLERGNYFVGIFCIIATAYIKLFGIVALALLIFYPGKWKLALYTLFWSVFLFALPLVVISVPQLLAQYKSWGQLLSNDHTVSTGLSVAGWLSSWFKLSVNKSIITLGGVILFCLPFIRYKEYSNYLFRLLAFSSVLIWVVIFNHRAESPTYIIAMGGVAIWFFSQKFTTENFILFLLAIVFTSLSPTDLFPPTLRKGLFQPYVVKAVPCILIWIKVLYDQLFNRNIQLETDEQHFEFADNNKTYSRQ